MSIVKANAEVAIMNKTGMLVAVEIDAVMGKYGSGKMIKKARF